MSAAVVAHSSRRPIAARDKRLVLYALSLVCDCLAIAAASGPSFLLRDSLAARASLSSAAVLLPLYVMFAIAREVQSVETLRERSLAIRRSCGALLSAILVVALAAMFFKVPDTLRLAFAETALYAALFLICAKFLFAAVVRLALGHSPTAEVLITDGVDVEPASHMEVIDVTRLGIWPDLAQPAMIDAVSRMIAPFDRVVVACRSDRRKAWATFLKGSDVGGELLVDTSALEGAVAIGACGVHDTLVISRGPLSVGNRIQKRIFDVAAASAILIIVGPLMLAVAVAIKMDSPGPVFFRQIRVGQGNRMFRIFKFRSMYAERGDLRGSVSASRTDDRVTRVGQVIRRTSIDELPQLFNVLRGDMSMVGPRPHALGSLAGDALFWEVTDRYWIRHALKPGITGLAQIRGYRGATENREELEKRVRCDLEYLSNWSLIEDVLILMRTVRVIRHEKAF